MRIRPLIAGAAALALALSLTACGDDGDEGSTDSETTEAPEDTAADETTEAEDTTEPEETEPETSASEPAEEVDLAGLLLTPADIGDTFVEGPYEATEEPGPCGVSLDTDHPYDEIAGVLIGDEAQGLFLQHEIRTYADEATATETYTAAAEEAFACGAETEEAGLTLGEVTDVTADIGGDASSAVEVVDTESGQEGVVVFVRIGSAISVYQFVGPAGSEDGPDPVAIVVDNVAAIEAALA
jgi:hypothetical protein